MIKFDILAGTTCHFSLFTFSMTRWLSSPGLAAKNPQFVTKVFQSYGVMIMTLGYFGNEINEGLSRIYQIIIVSVMRRWFSTIQRNR